ncbi:MAG: hypothetical protein KJN97_08245, partial [Deltaproteobacteria bacterium]|nr:hypothetical protein [Deltaproteobacteria bacterium]
LSAHSLLLVVNSRLPSNGSAASSFPGAGRVLTAGARKMDDHHHHHIHRQATKRDLEPWVLVPVPISS